MQTLRLPAREESLPQLRQLALEEAARAGLDQAAQERVELVLEEALVNVIRHAYPEDTPDEARPVELAGGTDPDGGFVLALSDWGRAFDPVGAADGEDLSAAELLAGLESNLEADLEHREPGGMGLFLIRTMSRAEYRRTDGANVLTLRFPGDAEAV